MGEEEKREKERITKEREKIHETLRREQKEYWEEKEKEDLAHYFKIWKQTHKEAKDNQIKIIKTTGIIHDLSEKGNKKRKGKVKEIGYTTKGKYIKGPYKSATTTKREKQTILNRIEKEKIR